jgi:hypothetical protein
MMFTLSTKGGIMYSGIKMNYFERESSDNKSILY